LLCVSFHLLCVKPTPPSALAPLSLHDALPIYPGDRVVAGAFRQYQKRLLVKPQARLRSGGPSEPSAAGNAHPHTRHSDVFWRSLDRKSTRLNSSHVSISYAVFCLKKKKIKVKQ